MYWELERLCPLSMMHSRKGDRNVHVDQTVQALNSLFRARLADNLLFGRLAAGRPVCFHALGLTLPGCGRHGPLLAGPFCSFGCVLASGRAAAAADCALERSNDLLNLVALGDECFEYFG